LRVGQAEIGLDWYSKDADDLAVDKVERVNDHENEHDVRTVRRGLRIHFHGVTLL
jgi:hypothetical protein